MRTFMTLALIFGATAPARADVDVFLDMPSWANAVDDQFHTVTFTELGGFAFLDDQYAHLGITFPEFNDFIDDSTHFQNDNWGASGFDATLTVDFAMDVNFVAIHYPGGMWIRLFQDGDLIHQVTDLPPSNFAFAGVVSDESFDRVVFLDPNGSVNIDDLHIPLIPGPAAGALLVLAGLAPRGRRRRESDRRGEQRRGGRR